MDQVQEVTAEFKTEEILHEAEALATPVAPRAHSQKSWIPVVVGFLAMIIMASIAFRFWLAA